MVTRYFISVRNLPWTVSHFDFETYFAAYGTVKLARVVFDKSGLSTGYGIVEYYNRAAVKEVLAKPHHILEETRVHVTKGTKYLQETRIKELVKRNYFIEVSSPDEPKDSSTFEDEDENEDEDEF